jgi:ribosomal protein S18 acetylase RimI-like enzyme
MREPPLPTIPAGPATGIDLAADVLARAFFDDPFSVYILPDAEDREDLLYWYYGSLVQYGLLCGDVYTTPAGAGVAVWLPYGDGDQSPEVLQRSGLLDAPDVLGMAAFERLVNLTGHLERVRKQRMPATHWYLPAIGVDPAHQGGGCGSALLRAALARADAEGLPCYLETFNPRNAPFYQRHGFLLVNEEVEPASGLPFWTFCRDPRP